MSDNKLLLDDGELAGVIVGYEYDEVEADAITVAEAQLAKCAEAVHRLIEESGASGAWKIDLHSMFEQAGFTEEEA